MLTTVFLALSRPLTRTIALVLGALGLIWAVLGVYGRSVRQKTEAAHQAKQARIESQTTKETQNATRFDEVDSALEYLRNDLERMR